MKFICRLLLIPLLTAALHAQALSELTQAALSGKTVTCTVTAGTAPFETTGTFQVKIDSPAVGQYTIPVGGGNTVARTGTYTLEQFPPDISFLKLYNYVPGASGYVEFELQTITAFSSSPGKPYFSMFPGANAGITGYKEGYYSIGTGGGTTPSITTQPVARTVAAGGSVTFTVGATGGTPTYQWFFNNTQITGATAASYTIASVTTAHAGRYQVTVGGVGVSGVIFSDSVTLTVAAASNTARLSNVSIRAGAGSGSETLIVGVTIGGAGTSGSKTLLVRGTGPALTAFGVTGALADPVLTIFNGTTSIANNDDWNSDAQVIAQGTALGAFPLTAGSKDSALVGVIPSGGYTVQLTGKAGATGVALVEVYDGTASFTTATPRLTNVSARTQVGTGGNILITGFVVAGSGTRQVLIRATGPALAAFGVAGTLADPKLELYNGAGVKTDENDNWVASTAAAQTSVGAFPLTPGSKDSVIVVTLAPGSYTAQVSGVGATSGVALVEIYELP